MTYTRPASAIELAWAAADELYPPFANCFILSGTGTLDEGALRAAVAASADVTPGVRVALRGVLCGRRWVDTGRPPPVHVVRDCRWDGASLVGAPFLGGVLDVRYGPTADVWWLDGPTPRLVVRTLHAITDGGGILAWMDDLFRCLRGESPLGQPDVVTDDALAAAQAGPRRPVASPDALAPTGVPHGEGKGLVWMHRTVQGSARGMLGRVARAVADRAWSGGDSGPVRVEVPVDLRRHDGDHRASGNLSGSVLLQVGADDTAEALGAALKEAIAAGRHLDGIRGAAFLRHLPMWLMVAAGRQGATTHLARGRYGASAVVSNLGRVDLGRWQGGGFEAEHLVMVPPGSVVTPAFIAMVGSQAGITVMITMPAHLATRGRGEALLDALCEAVTG